MWNSATQVDWCMLEMYCPDPEYGSPGQLSTCSRIKVVMAKICGIEVIVIPSY